MSFKKIVSQPFAELSLNDLKALAISIWHEGYVPELNDLNQAELQKAGYLLDRLMRYNCVSLAKKAELLQLIKSIPKPPQSASSSAEPLAQKWALQEDITHLMSQLLKYQTRHYSSVIQSSS